MQFTDGTYQPTLLVEADTDGTPLFSQGGPYDPYEGQSRDEYLSMLADDYGCDIDTVFMMAEVLGPNEDFDGLVTGLEDLDAYTLL